MGKVDLNIQHTFLEDVVLQIPTKELLPEDSENYPTVKKALKSLNRNQLIYMEQYRQVQTKYRGRQTIPCIYVFVEQSGRWVNS